MSSPTPGCVRISAHSASSSGPGLSSTRSGMAALPTSWSQPPSRQRRTSPAGSAIRSAVSVASPATCSACASGARSRTAAANANARAIVTASGSPSGASVTAMLGTSETRLRPWRLAT